MRSLTRALCGALLALAAALMLAACAAGSHSSQRSDAVSPTEGTSQPSSAANQPSATASTSGLAPASANTVLPPPAAPAAAAVTTASAPPAGGLPLEEPTGSASQVITVVAQSTSSTTGVLQAWDKAPDGSWLKVGGAVLAHLGSSGLSAHDREGLSATPIGSFTLTQAFGADANPGTALPYHVTTPADWWISQYGGPYTSMYNTMQTCSGTCPFTQGNPNEHLHSETPYYNYAVVINYNTSPVVQGAGSAFFLHVNPDGKPTAGCVSIAQSNLISIMQWLNPAAQPRILIGIG